MWIFSSKYSGRQVYQYNEDDFFVLSFFQITSLQVVKEYSLIKIKI